MKKRTWGIWAKGVVSIGLERFEYWDEKSVMSV